MATKKLPTFKPLKASGLKAKAGLFGIDPATIAKLIGLFGEPLVTLLLQLLTQKQKLSLAEKAGFPGGDLVKQLIISFITNNTGTVLQWVNEGESALFDALVSLVSGKSSAAADLLTQYKAKILALDDTITAEVLDKVIATLNGIA